MLSLLFFAGATFATSPVRELRATWLSTVWNIDFPKNVGADAVTAEKQKAELTQVLDELAAANMNCCFFQVRTMCDAFYASQYEPWSQFLTGERGLAPQYDPLAFLIAEGHKRGIEVHAWLNPYRYASGAASFGTLPNDYAVTHPDWLLTTDKKQSILNPGMPEVRAQIVAVVEDIVSHYDVDGIVFDDYFYLDHATVDSMDQAQYEAYNPENLSRGDWRRANVNKMVAEVNAAIKAIKPWCRFGIGPAGVAAADPKVAAKYGVRPAPSPEGDWQYEGICSEPVAWLQQHSIDYISPQIYWGIKFPQNDFSQLSPWWYEVAEGFGRHCFVSHSFGRKAITSAKELNAEIEVNRAATRVGASGSVFFNHKGLTRNGYVDTLANAAYSTKALVPAMTWYKAPALKPVKALHVKNGMLTWKHNEAERFAVWAVQENGEEPVLIRVVYGKQMNVSIFPANQKFIVKALDRYGNLSK